MSPFATEVSDPSGTPERLAELTRDHPETHATAALNPVAYAGLLDWLGSLGEPAAKDALRRRDSVLAVRASDPPTPPAELAVLAAAIPVLRAAVVDNPSAYPELRVWITAQRGYAPAVNNLPAAVAMAATPSLVDAPAANCTEGCNVRLLAIAGVGHAVPIVVGDAGKVTGFVVNAGSPLAPTLPGVGAATTLDAVRAIYPDAQSTSPSDTSYLDVNYLTLTSGSQKIWLVADYIEANNPTTDHVGDIQIGSGAHITEEFCG